MVGVWALSRSHDFRYCVCGAWELVALSGIACLDLISRNDRETFREEKRRYKYITNHTRRGFSLAATGVLWSISLASTSDISRQAKQFSPLLFALTQATETTAHVLNIIYKNGPLVCLNK